MIKLNRIGDDKMFNYKGRVVVVSGASSGLGKQMSKAFADQGADVVVMARRKEKLDELKEYFLLHLLVKN